MKIPLVGVPEGPAPQETFRPVDPHTYDQVGEAGRHFGDALTSIGDLGVRIKGVWDDAAVTNLATKAAAAQKDAVNKLSTGIDPVTGQPDPRNNDPTTYQQRWNESKTEILKGLQEDPMAKGLGFEARGRLKDIMNNVVKDGDADVNILTRDKMLSIAGATNEVAIKGLVLSGAKGAEQQATALVDKMVKTGQRPPEWGAQQKILIPQQIDQNSAIHLMTTDVSLGGGPFVAQDKLKEQDANGNFTNFTRLLPEQRQELLRQASNDGRIIQAATRDKYGNYISNKIPIDPMEVKRDLTYRTLTASDARSLTKQDTTADTAEAFNDVMGRIGKLDPAAKDYPEQWAIGKAINNFTGINKDRAEQALKEKMNPNSPLNTPAFKDASQMIEGNFTGGIYGRLEYKVPNKDGTAFSTVPDAKGRAKANETRAQLQTALAEFASKNPDATPTQINDYLNGLQKTARASSFWGPAVNPLSGKANP